ncbi:hypothetical protein C8R42DRAFT_688313 [Lentinula raphanica]|nr:hypothetical protein C8R42DRAFT_688313 [Lentinula raphanica]
MSTGLPDLRNTRFFPSLYELPHDYYFDERESDYYSVSKDWQTRISHAQPSRHWCFFAEIVEYQPWPIRPMFKAKDSTGVTFLVSFNFDDTNLFARVLKKGLVGRTICVMYARFHAFADGQVGVRLEEPKDVKILPLSIEALVTASKTFRDSNPGNSEHCAHCGGPASQRCSSCSTIFYCSKPCQVQAWEKGHKNECMTMGQMKEWNRFDWEKYDVHRGFKSIL